MTPKTFGLKHIELEYTGDQERPWRVYVIRQVGRYWFGLPKQKSYWLITYSEPYEGFYALAPEGMHSTEPYVATFANPHEAFRSTLAAIATDSILTRPFQQLYKPI